jgi:20S proteasome alpha/beta subunit
MTLVIALACTDGVVLASDSQSTERTGNIRYPIQKTWQLSPHAVWGASGQGQVIQEIRTTLESVGDALDRTPDRAMTLVSLIKPVLEKHYANCIANVPGVPGGSPATDVLAAGCEEDGHRWILEVDHRCQYTYYEERGFHAIGSAAGFAQLANSLMAHYDARSKPLRYGTLVAYRAMKAAVDTSAFHVGSPIQLWTVNADGVRQFAKVEVDQAEADVGGWEEFEADALDHFLNPREEPVAPLPPEVSPEG